jgi:hypothetical protein
VQVERIRLDACHVPGPSRLDRIAADCLAKLRDRSLDEIRRARRRLIAPDGVDDARGGHHAAGLGEQNNQHATLARPTELDRPPVDQRHNRSEQQIPNGGPGCGRLRGRRPRLRKLRRKPFDHDLGEALRPLQIVQPPQTDVAQAQPSRQVLLRQVTRGPRDEHLASVRRSADTRSAMHGEAEVVPGRERRLAGVNAHSNAHLCAGGPAVGRQRTLGRRGGRHRVGSAPKDDEEGIAWVPTSRPFISVTAARMRR